MYILKSLSFLSASFIFFSLLYLTLHPFLSFFFFFFYFFFTFLLFFFFLMIRRPPRSTPFPTRRSSDLDVAKKYSDGPSAADGGALGLFKRGQLAKELEDKTFAMKAGEVTDVIRTKQGYVILKVVDHQQAGIPSLKDAMPKIQDALYYEKLQPALRAFLSKLREDAYIKTAPGYVDSGASPNETLPIETTSAKEADAKKLDKKRHKKLGVL